MERSTASPHASRPARRRTPGLGRILGGLALLPLASRAPAYARLVWSLVRDERVPASRKAVLGVALGYVLLARDVVPDDVPLLGGLDDLIVVVLAVELFLDGVPEALLVEKLTALGIDRRAFESDVATIRRLTPAPVRRLVRRLPGTVEAAGRALERSGVGARLRRWITVEGSIG